MNRLLPPDYNFFEQITKLAILLAPPKDKPTGFIKDKTSQSDIDLLLDINTQHPNRAVHLVVRQFGSEISKVNVPVDRSPLPYRTWTDYFDATEYYLYTALNKEGLSFKVRRDSVDVRDPRKEAVQYE